MSQLLNTILQATRARIEERKSRLPLAELRQRLQDAPPVRSLLAALRARPFSVIAEHKRRSPSGGAMLADNLARCLDVYAAAPWVTAISVLTDEDHFGGELSELAMARERVGARPVLRKDFIVDEYQVYEARAFGADAILLMTAVHARSPEQFARLFHLAADLGMDCLIELGMGDGDPRQLASMVPGEAGLWGVNSRAFVGNMGSAKVSSAAVDQGARDLLTSLERHDELFHLVPEHALAVAESGLHSAQDLLATARKGYRAALIGTAFLKGPASVEEVAKELASAFSADGLTLRGAA